MTNTLEKLLDLLQSAPEGRPAAVPAEGSLRISSEFGLAWDIASVEPTQGEYVDVLRALLDELDRSVSPLS